MSGGGPRLAFDTSTGVGSVALAVGDRVAAEVSFRAVSGHSSALLPAVQSVMESVRVQPGELEVIVVGAGPGSFTGIRIAAATAKGMVHSLGIPLYAYSSLAAVAAGVTASSNADAERVVCAMFDARGRDVFTGCFRFSRELEVVVAPTALDLDEAVARAREVGVEIYAGDGALRHASDIEEEAGGIIAPERLAHPRAAALLELAARYPDAGRVSDAAAWQPDYLRPSGAERIAAQRAVSAAKSAG